MKRQISVLDQSTIDKIAAGEVVERPSSVVKELVENAIDAGASAITVEIKEGGTTFIRITDMVLPDHVNDSDMVLLARDISKQIEAELEYPGQIKVSVIRESRVVDYAK